MKLKLMLQADHLTAESSRLMRKRLKALLKRKKNRTELNLVRMKNTKKALPNDILLL